LQESGGGADGGQGSEYVVGGNQFGVEARNGIDRGGSRSGSGGPYPQFLDTGCVNYAALGSVAVERVVS
jgi:hypothetical protein